MTFTRNESNKNPHQIGRIDMYRRSTVTRIVSAAALLSSAAATASAVPQFVQSTDTPHCDPLMSLSLVDELGLPAVFPFGERIDSFALPTNLSACPSHDNPNIPNVIVTIINLNPFTFSDLHYVADPTNATGLPGTSIGNEDGLVNGGQAFRIDMVGVNTPLSGESMTVDGLFQPGEIWRFVIDDYVNTGGIPASAFLSIGVGAASGGPPSSGSIIGLPIPEPGVMGLAGSTVVPLLRRRRRGRV